MDNLEPETAYQFSVLAQNKLGTSSFSEVVTVNTLGETFRRDPSIPNPRKQTVEALLLNVVSSCTVVSKIEFLPSIVSVNGPSQSNLGHGSEVDPILGTQKAPCIPWHFQVGMGKTPI